MTTFDDVVSATPWRTALLIATVDGVRLWELSDGELEWQIPQHFTDDDLQRLRNWLYADLAARKAGKPKPRYLDFRRPDAPVVPITVDEMAFLAGYPPDGVNLQALLDEAEGIYTDESEGGGSTCADREEPGG